MGNCGSSQVEAVAKQHSDEIDKQIEEDLRKFKKECKILLLGASSRAPALGGVAADDPSA
jgi:guanine nucleotide-binding protein G(i) subunit alpha